MSESHVEEVLKIVAELNNLYKLGEVNMASRSNVASVNDILCKADLAFKKFSLLSSCLGPSDVIPGTSCTKVTIETNHSEFTLRIVHWLENIRQVNVSNTSHGTTPFKARPTVGVGDGSTARASDADISLVSTSHVGTFPVTDSEYGIAEVSLLGSRDIARPVVCSTEVVCSSQSLHRPTLIEKTVSDFQQDSLDLSVDHSVPMGAVTKDELIETQSDTSFVSSRSNYTTVSRLEEARIKLEIARLTKLQNEERMKEEAAEAELARQKEEMKRCQEAAEAELARQKRAAEDERQIKLAELKLALLEQDTASLHSSVKTKFKMQKFVKSVPTTSAEPATSEIYGTVPTSVQFSGTMPCNTVPNHCQTVPKYCLYDRGKYPTHSGQSEQLHHSRVQNFASSVPTTPAYPATSKFYNRAPTSVQFSGTMSCDPVSNSCKIVPEYCQYDRGKYPAHSGRNKPLHESQCAPSNVTTNVYSTFERPSTSRNVPLISSYEQAPLLSYRWRSPHETAPRESNFPLPKPVIQDFDGDPLDYWAFYNRLQGHIPHWLPPEQKMSYLLQHCIPRVRQNISHFADLHSGEDCYNLAWEELKRRYGLPHIIAQACEEQLIAFPKLDRDVSERLNKLSILMKRCRFAMADEMVISSLDSVQLLGTIAGKFFLDLKRRWVEHSAKITEQTGKLARFADLADFVDEQAREANSVFGLKLFNHIPARTDVTKKSRVSSFQTSAVADKITIRNANKEVKCLLCSEKHKLYRCKEFRKASVDDRWKIVKKLKLCKVCLNTDHLAYQCTYSLKCRVDDCGSTNHNSLLHRSRERPDKTEGGSELTSSEDVADESEAKEIKTLATLSKRPCGKSPYGVYLDIVPVQVVVEDSNKVIQTYALLDSGSDKSFCEKRLAEQFKLESTPIRLAVQTLTPGNPHVLDTKVVSFNLTSLDNTFSVSLNEAVVVESIPVAPSTLPSKEHLSKCTHLSGIDLQVIENGSVTLLLGNDCVAAHRCLESRFSPDPEVSPDAVLSPFGWFLRGKGLGDPQLAKHSSNFLVRGLNWPTDVQLVDDVILTDEGEMFSTNPQPDLCDKESLIKMLQDHHEILEFGLHYSLEDPVAYDIMTRNLRHVDKHFQLPLLWKNDAVRLPPSKEMALKRLASLKKRLVKNAELREKYSSQMEKIIDAGYAERVDEVGTKSNNREWYLPHQPVFSASKPDKVRVVHDCAASSNGRSLNDFLMKGPDLVNSLVGVLLRFRKGQIAVTSDIEAMFYQVRVAPHDRDSLRFFWWPNGNLNSHPEIYRMAVHLFGAKSSPSCATFCLRQTAKEFGKYFDPIVSSVVLNNFYVDDCLFSVDDEEKAITLSQDLTALLEKGGFKLTKWLSNSAGVLEKLPKEKRSSASVSPMPTTGICQRVLGLNWDVLTDKFYINVNVHQIQLTKRGVLAVTNSLYDPLGFVAPVVLRARLIYSEICKEGNEWDEELKGKCLKRWRLWMNGLPALENVRIERYFQVKAPVQIQLHFFSDASNAARGTVCYVRFIKADASIDCRIVMAKSRIASPAKRTIPRMELEAALDSVCLARLVIRELDLCDTRCFFWTDSMIVLQSLQAETKRFPLFPRNRLNRILKHSKVYDWNHVPSHQNPADLVSRGSTADELSSSDLWFSGPPFLKLEPENWPLKSFKTQDSEEVYSCYNLNQKETTSQSFTFSVAATQPPEMEDPISKLIGYFSSFHKLKLATSWISRFITFLAAKNQNLRESYNLGISVLELNNAELCLIRYVQKIQFKDEISALEKNKTVNTSSRLYQLNPILVDRIVRVGGRLGDLDLPYDLKHPVILPDSGCLTSLIIRDTHIHSAKHGGVSITLNLLCQRYWILNAKVITRRVISDCVTCKLIHSRMSHQKMANFPKARFMVKEPPFSHVGTDFFGPLITKVRRSNVKRYGCIFTCMTTRAVHFEVANDLSTSSFINALRRFLSRRGPVKHIYSDNGTNFVGSAKVIKENIQRWNQLQVHDFLRQKQIEWSFNTPNASHTGGVWERLIRSAKEILMAIAPKDTPTDDELHTLLLEVEAVINSRPLTDVPLEVGQDLPLTPNHLLRVNSEYAMSVPEDPTACYSRQRYRHVQHSADIFWKRWIAEYPKTIIKRSKWYVSNRNLSSGDIVLMVDVSSPRGKWPLGKVVEVFPDSKGLVRTASVKTANGVFRRPTCKLCLILPASSSAHESKTLS